MERLKSISSRLLITKDEKEEEFNHEPNANDKKWAIEKCKEMEEYDESNFVVMWIKKIKKEAHKQVRRLLVITEHRLFTARLGGTKKNVKFEIRRESHILDLTCVQLTGLVIFITFRDFKLDFECDEDARMNKVLNTLYRNYMFNNPGYPSELSCQWLDQYKSSMAPELQKKVPVVGDSLAPWEKPYRSFRSYCFFYKEPNKNSLPLALKSILRRPLDENIENDERWLRTTDLSCNNPKTVHGLIISVAFTDKLLHGIELSDIKDGGGGDLFYAIGVLLKYNTSLLSLVMDGVSTGPEWGDLMTNALIKNPKSMLKRYGLKNSRIGEKGVQNWIDGNKKLARQPECLYMTKANVSSKTMVQFIQCLKATNDYGPGLTELDISGNPLESRGTQMLSNRLLKDFKDLKMLNVSKCNIDCQRLLTALEQCSKKQTLFLEEIDISYNRMTQQDGLILSRILANSGTCASLNVAGCGLSGSTIASCLAALLSNDSLRFYVRIDASDNNIGCEAAIMFASIFVLCDRIMSLKLNNCDLSHEGMGYILFALLNQPRLRVLELDCNCKREEWNTGRYHVNQLIKKVLDKCLNLESLSLKNDPERQYQIDLDHFLHAMKTNNTVLSLDISGNNMTNDNLVALKEVVTKNETMRELHWDNNNITSVHIVGITHALKQNGCLQVVEFPEKDFQKQLAREKRAAKKMELQLIKKNFYKALFDNNTKQGFQTTTVNIQRQAAKRGSFMATRPQKISYVAPKGMPNLGLPQQQQQQQQPMNNFNMNMNMNNNNNNFNNNNNMDDKKKKKKDKKHKSKDMGNMDAMPPMNNSSNMNLNNNNNNNNNYDMNQMNMNMNGPPMMMNMPMNMNMNGMPPPNMNFGNMPPPNMNFGNMPPPNFGNMPPMTMNFGNMPPPNPMQMQNMNMHQY